MARSRSLKPGFHKNADLIALPPLTRILFAGLWTIADREGRLEDRPKQIKIEVLPGDSCNIDKMLDQLQESGFIIRYAVGAGRYISIPTWHKHQNPHMKESPSTIPPPPSAVDRYNHDPVIESASRSRIHKRDGGQCVLCGSTENLTLDHIVERCDGGSSLDENLRTLCGKCNQSRPGISRPIRGKAGASTNLGSGEAGATSGKPDTNRASSLTPDSLNLTPDSLSSDCFNQSPITVNPEPVTPTADSSLRAVDALCAVAAQSENALFEEFIGVFLAAGVKLSGRDVQMAGMGTVHRPGFLGFDPAEQQQILAYVIEKAQHTEARYMGLPANFLDKREWERKGIERALPNPTRTKVERAQEEAARMFMEGK